MQVSIIKPYPLLSATQAPITSTSIFVRRKQSSASSGRQPVGWFSFPARHGSAFLDESFAPDTGMNCVFIASTNPAACATVHSAFAWSIFSPV